MTRKNLSHGCQQVFSRLLRFCKDRIKIQSECCRSRLEAGLDQVPWLAGAVVMPRMGRALPRLARSCETPVGCYLDVLKKHAVFSGRAQRCECWMIFPVDTLCAVAHGAGRGSLVWVRGPAGGVAASARSAGSWS